MPLRRFRRQYEQLSQFERGRIIGMTEARWSAKRVARQLGRSDFVVRRCWNQWIREMSFSRPGSGRPRQTSRREDHPIVKMAAYSQMLHQSPSKHSWCDGMGCHCLQYTVTPGIDSCHHDSPAEELNDYEKLKSIVLREFQVTPRECLNSFKNAVKSSGETYIQFAARLTANFQYYCSLIKVNSFESLCDLLISDKLFETLNKETATHIGIREAEDWFRPIDLAKECDIYISSRSGSRKETPTACGYTEDPFKNRPRNYKPKIKDSYPQNLERQNKNCYICGDSSHYARDCERRFKPKESNGHIHNRKT
ncbi:DUF1758 domain-containing protein [Trichonephila clavipes]|nr:DUF1758 domain-containing protein [Trichonephila clavipes]